LSQKVHEVPPGRLEKISKKKNPCCFPVSSIFDVLHPTAELVFFLAALHEGGAQTSSRSGFRIEKAFHDEDARVRPFGFYRGPSWRFSA